MTRHQISRYANKAGRDLGLGQAEATNARDTGNSDLIADLERSPGEGHGNPLQYS